MQRLFPREPATSAPRRAVTDGGPSS
jgi:hypothetical protein